MTHYIATEPGDDGRFGTAVNMRVTDPSVIADVPISLFDGLDAWRALPRDGRTVKGRWF